MNTHLMFRNRDFDSKAARCAEWDTLSADLELERIISKMSGGDDMVLEVCTAALAQPLTDTDDIIFRQENVKDALANEKVVRDLYEITVEAEKKRRGSWSYLDSYYLSSTFSSAVSILQIYTEMLEKLRHIADTSIRGFRYTGFLDLLTMFQNELSNEYLHTITSELKALRENNGIIISAHFGSHLEGIGYEFRQKGHNDSRMKWMFAPSFTIADRDDKGAKDLGMRRDRAINESTNALAQAADHLEHFFASLRTELAFYIGCLNLADSLRLAGMTVCIPALMPSTGRDRSYHGQYDISLVITKIDSAAEDPSAVGNSLDSENKRLYIITGANQGGKTTFLRSLGQSQIMAQCGMFIGAESASIPIRNGIFTHFKKEEDNSMTSGKLDEELVRMDLIIPELKRDSLMLFNESFSATNEREGSEICRQITSALIENNIEIFSVTHLYPYAVYYQDDIETQYLRAERDDNGVRSFRLIEGKPLLTAFGGDLYKEIFDDTIIQNIS